MSKIEKELAKATGVETERGESRQEFLFRLAKGVSDLTDQDYDKLSAKAQDWFDDNADARNKAKKAGKELPDFTDFPDVEKEEEQPRRRRSSDDDGDDKGKGAKERAAVGGPDILAVGQEVKIETKRGKEIEGEVTKLDEKEGFVEIGGKDGDEIDLDKIATVTVLKAAKAEEETRSTRSTRRGAKEEEANPAEPHVGAEVKLTTKRGKQVEGEIVELTADEIVLKTDDGEEDFRMDRVETIKVLKPAKGAKASSKASEKEEKEEKGDKGEKAPRAKNAEGVSIGQRIKELIADNLDAGEEEIGKLLKKEKIEFKDNTLKLNYAETHKTISVLKEAGLLKTKK